jgi:4'-phosphopantetheinyl transferase
VWIADLDGRDVLGGDALSEDERFRAERFRRAADRERYTAGRALLRQLLADRLGVPAGSITLAAGPQGKPHVAYPAATLEFNVAHSGRLALVAISSSLPVGIDVERIDPDLDWEPLSSRFFAAAEDRAIKLLPEEDRRAGFFACWTRKEAVVKAIGMGLSYPLHDFEVTIDPHADPELLRGGQGMRTDEWMLRDLDAGAGFRACIAAPGAICVRAHTG